MPAITSTNKESFKSHIKTWRKIFTSPLQQINLSDIENVFEYTSSLLTIGSQTVKVGLFGGREGDDVLDISSLTGGELLYLPGQVSDYVKIKTNNTTNNNNEVTSSQEHIDTIHWQYALTPRVVLEDNSSNYLYLNETFQLGSKILTVKALGGLLVSVEDAPTYTVTHTATQHEVLPDGYFITEGDSITFTITTANFPNGSNSSNNTGNGTLYWSLGGTVDSSDFNSNSGSVYISNNTANITIDSFTDTSIESESFRLFLRKGDSDGTIVATSDFISLRDKEISVAITPSVTTIDEGGQVTFTVNTVGYDNGDVLYYKPLFTSGQADSSDISNQYGSLTINNSTASFVVTASQDVYEESAETFQYIIYENTDQSGNAIPLATSSSVSITNTTSYNFSVSASTISEVNSVVYTVNTVGIPNGTSLRWYITTMSMTDFTYRNGIFYINNNTGSFTITPKQDFDVESDEILTVELRASSSSTSVLSTVNTIPNVTVTDTPYTVTVTPSSPLTIVESAHDSTSQVVLTITTTGAPDGSQLTVHERTNTGDITFDNSTITINNNSATVTATIVRDGRTEGSEDHIIDFKNQSSQVVASSPTITITDTSFVGSRADGKTFGPIDVTRDSGIEQLASDWYDLCDIDSIGDGSKISLFIDNSGSLTTGHVQKALEKFVEKLAARNISIVVVENGNEDWITPFDTVLI